MKLKNLIGEFFYIAVFHLCFPISISLFQHVCINHRFIQRNQISQSTFVSSQILKRSIAVVLARQALGCAYLLFSLELNMSVINLKCSIRVVFQNLCHSDKQNQDIVQHVNLSVSHLCVLFSTVNLVSVSLHLPLLYLYLNRFHLDGQLIVGAAHMASCMLC